MRRSRFFLSESGGGGGGGSKSYGEKTALIFFYVCFRFLVQNFPGMRGSNYLQGGGPKANFYGI